MAVRNAKAVWKGTLKEGGGTMSFTDYNGSYTYASRFEKGEGTNPEELVGAAISGCYSMFLSGLIASEGFTPDSIETTAIITFKKDDIGPLITKIELNCKVSCDGLSQSKFKELSLSAKEKCPISRLYTGGTAKIDLDASLTN